jgi:outer membrane protein W
MIETVSSLGIALVLCAGSRAAAETERGWGIEVSGGSVQSVSELGLDSSAGFGLALEYRASRRLGVQLGVLTSEIDSEFGFEFFDLDLLVIESRLRMTPVLARLDVHLTPDRKVDLYMGPVLGYVRYGDIKTEVRSDVFGNEPISVGRVRTRDGFAWGAQIGMDIPMGSRGTFFTLGATYLQAEVETSEETDEGALVDSSFDLNPFVVQAGFGYRF